MIKSELRKLQTLNATPEMMQKARENEQQTEEKAGFMYSRVYKRKYAMYLRCQNLQGYLKIAIFLPGDMIAGSRSPRFEIFINQESGSYITREWIKGQEFWRAAKIENLNYNNEGRYYLYQAKEKSWINQEGSRSIKKILKVKEGGFYGILEYQERILKANLQERRQREVKPWDEDMALIPKTPKGFEKWWQKEAIREHFIFYHYDRKGASKGFCSHCEKEVPVKDPKHNKEGRCPGCHEKIKYKSDGKIRGLCSREYRCQLLQKIEGGFAVRSFQIWKTYRGRHYTDPHYGLYEHKRVLYRGNRTDTYEWGLYKNEVARWCRGSTGYWNYSGTDIYPGNLTVLGKTVLRHSGLPDMAKAKVQMDADRYLYKEKCNPAIEKLVRLGMYRLVKDFLENFYDPKLLKRDETALHKILQIDKGRLKRLKGMDGGIHHLRWLQLEKRENMVLPDEAVCYFAKYDLDSEEIRFVSIKMSYVKIYHYLQKQEKLVGDTAGNLVGTWRDYLNMAEKAKMDINSEMIYKPKNLKAAHNDAVLLLEQKKIEKMAADLAGKWPEVNGVCRTLKKYEMQGEKYCIVAPKGIEDIIREGTILKHCIHTCDFYFDRIGRKESYLLFLRWKEKPDTPYYTLEVEPGGNIRQKRTTGDNQNEDFKLAVPFLKKWQKEIRKRLTKEEEELGRKSDELRRENYAQIRKDGKLVWHGKLAGKPLADVLEADFMEAIG